MAKYGQEGDKEMTYTKPAVMALANPIDAIQNADAEKCGNVVDGSNQPIATSAAYQADE